MDEQLGAALRQLRDGQGWSLSYVGEICGTSGANISKIERGQAKEYGLSLLKALAAAYGLKLYELFAMVESVDVNDQALERDERKLVGVYKALTPRQRETLMSVALTLRAPR